MTTFGTQVLVCPHCGNKMYSYMLTSYYVHSSVLFSDGHVDRSPPVFPDSRILICTECKLEFWRDDACLEDENGNFSNTDLPEAKDIHDSIFAFDADVMSDRITYYSGLLERGFANTVDNEIYLRIEIWHLLNHNLRYKPSGVVDSLLKGNLKEAFSGEEEIPEAVKPLFKSNLEKLINVYIPENDNERLMLAEMYRELGNFEKALSILEEIDDIKNENCFKEIKKAIKRKNSKVILIT
jgi:tetratricopeptide (TPR) repeat protein